MTDSTQAQTSQTPVEDIDVVIVGAGLSGIGTACHLQQQCPGTGYAILESRPTMGGTWDLFRYPGIRSDSDMHTLGYSFKPWRAAKSIADGPAILDYVHETAREFDVEKNIRFNQRLIDAAWSSEDARWTLTIEHADGAISALRCNFLSMCCGYYNYAKGYTPEFTGLADFSGAVVHPQHWPQDLDCAGKKVVVIGSGATAMTLVPALARDGATVTMVQRSPTYVASRPDRDAIANGLRKFLPEKWAYAVTRWKNVTLQKFFYGRSRTQPEKVKKALIDRVRTALGPDYDVDTHFTPSYYPWDERLCLIPNDDLFDAIKDGSATVVTETIDRITPQGVRLDNGDELTADVIVTATGLNMEVMGGTKVSVDGTPVNFPETYTYKGMMFSGVPNLVQTFGYINASWTLRADLTAEFVCRLVNHLQATGTERCTPTLRADEADMPAEPWIRDFSPGYMQRVMHLFPRQGDRAPWLNTQNYAEDKKLIRKGELDDGVLLFEARAQAPAAVAQATAPPELPADVSAG